MITNYPESDPKKTVFNLYGLSTDTKPTRTFDGRLIANGSSFFEMDTQEVSFYDADNEVWV